MFNVVERINELMRQKNWSAYELSIQTGISTNAIYDWNKIGATPTLPNIIKICDAMGITLEYFFCGGMYKYTKEENEMLDKWIGLSDLEKETVLKVMETFKILKSN